MTPPLHLRPGRHPGEPQELPVPEHQLQGMGCYPGCYYYTDSCFRKDCLKTNDMTKPTAQAIADMTNAVLSDLNVVKQHLGPHTFNKTEEAWAGIETFIAISLRVFAQTNPSKLRDVMRTVEIQTRMDGKEIFE